MKINERVARLEAIVPEINEKLGRLDAKMDGLDHVVRGNGAPGLAAKVESLTSTHRRWRDVTFTIAGGIVVGVVVSIFSSWSASHVKQQVQTMSNVQQKP